MGPPKTNISISDFLKPDLRLILVFLLFSFICVGGVVQSYAFVDDVQGVHKPFLYDFLKPFCLWVPWVFFAAPIHVFGYFLGLEWILGFFPSLDATKLPVASLIYSYLVSYWVFYTWDKWLKAASSKIKFLIFFVPVSLAMLKVPLVTPFWLLGFTSYIFSLSCLLFLSAVLIAYFVSIYGFIKLTSTSLRKLKE